MGKTYAKLSVSPRTKRLIREECKKEFLRHNPDFEGMFLSEEFLVKRIAEHYIMSWG